MNRKNLITFVAAPALFMLVGCQTTKTDVEPEPAPIPIGAPDDYSSKGAPASFEQFQTRTIKGDYEANIEAERYGLLKEAAVAYSAQAGYQRRVWQVMRQLEVDSGKLSQTYDFNRVVYRAPRETGYILPPVVSRATAAVNVDEGGQKAVAADEYYRLEIPGRIVTVVPTWRDYLVIPLEDAAKPEDDFLPQNKEEKRVFDRFVAEGWQAGVEQADEALELNFARLKRDYLGMLEYCKMLAAGLVSDLVIDSSERRSTGEGDELYIGERTVKIVNSAQFVRNPVNWKPLDRRYSVAK